MLHTDSINEQFFIQYNIESVRSSLKIQSHEASFVRFYSLAPGNIVYNVSGVRQKRWVV